MGTSGSNRGGSVDGIGSSGWRGYHEQDEYDLVHLPQATLLPMSQLASRVDELDPYREQEILVLCHHGMRSLRAAQRALEMGFTDVHNVVGGIDAWSQTVDPSVPRY